MGGGGGGGEKDLEISTYLFRVGHKVPFRSVGDGGSG